MWRRVLWLLALASLTTTPVGAQVVGTTPTVGGGGQSATLAQPDLGITLPFAVGRDSAGHYWHGYDATVRRPTPTVTIYVGPGGDNAADGLTWATRVRSLRQGLVRAGGQTLGTVVRILAQVGEYRSTSVDGSAIKDSFGGWLSGNAARDTVIEPCDASGNPLPASDGRWSKANQIISVIDIALPAFVATADPRVFVSTYTTGSPGRSGWDRAYSNRFGRPLGLMQLYDNGIADRANPLPEINKMADTFGKGAMYLDTTAKKVWVRLSDGRAPDSQVSFGEAARQFYYVWSSRPSRTTKIFMRNVDLMGGFVQIYDGFTSPTGGSPVELTAMDVYSGSTHSGAWTLYNEGSTVWQRNVVSDYGIDAYSTAWSNDPAATGNHVWYELDSIAEWSMGNSGLGDASANASTSHDRSIGVAVNAEYRYTSNRATHDIANARAWRVGSKIGPSIRASDDYSGLVAPLSDSFKKAAVAVASGYYDETGAQSTKVWIDGLTVTGPMTFSLGAYNNVNGGGVGGTIYWRNVTAPVGVGSTVASPYAGSTAVGSISGW